MVRYSKSYNCFLRRFSLTFCMIKHSPLLLLIVLIFTFSLIANSTVIINIGDSRDTVISIFGTPSGCVERSNKEILCFSNGEVTLVSGVVSKVNLRSNQEQVRYLERKMSMRENVRQRIEALEKKRVERENEINQNQGYRDALTQEAQQWDNNRLVYQRSSGYSLARRENFHRPSFSNRTPRIRGSHSQRLSSSNLRGRSINGNSHIPHNSVNQFSNDRGYRQQANCSRPYNFTNHLRQSSRGVTGGRTHFYVERTNQINRSSHINTHRSVHLVKLNTTQRNSLAHASNQGFRNQAQFCRNQNNIIRTNHSVNHHAAHLAKLNRQ